MKVLLLELEHQPDGSHGVGQYLEVPVAEAIELIRTDKAFAVGYSRGVIPPEWEIPGKKQKVAAVEAEAQ